MRHETIAPRAPCPWARDAAVGAAREGCAGIGCPRGVRLGGSWTQGTHDISTIMDMSGWTLFDATSNAASLRVPEEPNKSLRRKALRSHMRIQAQRLQFCLRYPGHCVF